MKFRAQGENERGVSTLARTHNTHDKLGECVARGREEKCGMSECREHDDDDDDTQHGTEWSRQSQFAKPRGKKSVIDL